MHILFPMRAKDLIQLATNSEQENKQHWLSLLMHGICLPWSQPAQEISPWLWKLPPEATYHRIPGAGKHHGEETFFHVLLKAFPEAAE